MHYRMLSSIPGLYPLNTNNYSSSSSYDNQKCLHCQMYPGDQNHSQMRTIELGDHTSYFAKGNSSLMPAVLVKLLIPPPFTLRSIPVSKLFCHPTWMYLYGFSHPDQVNYYIHNDPGFTSNLAEIIALTVFPRNTV